MQIHADEAGTDKKEPVVTVASVLINPDKQFLDLERSITAAIEDTIPEEIRPGFVFHAKDIYNKHRKRFGWSLPECHRIVERWLSIITDVYLPVGVGWYRKEQQNGVATKVENAFGHMLAFAQSVSVADRFIRERLPDQVASLIVEDVGDMREKLRIIFRAVRDGELAKHGFHAESITHIKSGPFFAAKQDAPIMQLADACAFSAKRYLMGKPDGDRLWSKLIGAGRPFDTRRDYTGDLSGAVLIGECERFAHL